jgi:hypothetical protein
MPQLCTTGLFAIAGRNVAGETMPQIALNLNAVYYVGCGASWRARVEFGVAPVLAVVTPPPVVGLG